MYSRGSGVRMGWEIKGRARAVHTLLLVYFFRAPLLGVLRMMRIDLKDLCPIPVEY